jgi:hypothetical protein
LHLRLLLLIPAVALLILGGEGVYHAVLGRERVSTDCQSLARARPPSHRLHVNGCEIDYAGVGFRGSDAVEEVFFPARPSGSGVPAPIVIVTRNPAVVAIARTVVGGGRSIPADQSLPVLQKAAAIIAPNQRIDGLVRAGMIERWRTRRIVSGLTSTPVAADAMLIDLEGAPDFLQPLIAMAGALLLAVLALGLPRRRPRDANWKPLVIAPVIVPQPPVVAAPRQPPPAVSPAVRLPRLLLLNLAAGAGPDAVETAPPLGPRDRVIEILRGVVPDLDLAANRRTLSRHDNSLRVALGAAETVATAVVEARGEPGAALVREILLLTGWRAFAPKTGLFVNGDELAVIAALAKGD